MPQKTVVNIEGHSLTLTNLDKVLYPESGTTKGEVLAYYVDVASVLIPHCADRAATRKRWVNGVGTIDEPGAMFFQKNLDDATPSWVARGAIEHKGHTNLYPLVNDLATLTWLGQIAALEIHVPQWRFDETGAPQNPDRLVLDLDPGEGAGLIECAEVARYARSILVGMGLDPMPVTSGSKGIHLYAALDGSQTSAEVSAVVHELARELEADHPDLIVSDLKKSTRAGKVLVDWSQNNGAKTTVTPYSLRGRHRPTVAAPRTWRELASTTLAQLDYTEVLDRVARSRDPLAAVATSKASSSPPDRLAKYRQKRNAAATPEPLPAHSPIAASGNRFVIQEHHARRLHWDFRLEHDGVLMSWALPKGVPTDPTHNHLAVQTEDHPLEYGTFEGTIPAGQYGGGQVTIWDSGTFELEKWREGKEVIVTLHGRIRGSHRYALIHTGETERAANNWLIHLMADAPTLRPMLATPGAAGQLSPESEWAYEMKWDGIRALATVSDGKVTLTSRNGKDLTHTYPELSQLAEATDVDVVVDGEIVAISPSGRPDFALLQGGTVPAHFMAFDLLALSGQSLLKRSYDDRRRALIEHIRPRGSVQVPPAFEGNEAAALEFSRTLQLEGIVAKRRDSSYLPGKRGRSWVKIKHHRSQEVVVGGWTAGQGNRAGSIGALLLGIPSGDGLRYVGKVGTGFTAVQRESMLKRFVELAQSSTPFSADLGLAGTKANWITPALVGEVEFAEWTPGGRLRHATWRGWRADKTPAEVVVEGR